MIGFSAFLQATPGGRAPYSWQTEFAERAADGHTPSAVGVPTGCGKTTVVEALVWALASQAERPASERTVGVRTVWAIDRRILVDEVFDRASALADHLEDVWLAGDSDHPLYEVTRRLQLLKDPDGTLAGEALGPPLLATRWRGGIELAPPAKHPRQAEIITSTVAQIGSRLLFRGYGLGLRSRQLGAALAACDTTICLDEAHLAEPFAATARAIAARRREEPEPVAPPVAVVRLSATLGDERPDDPPVMLSPEDRKQLASRLGAPKTARLVDPEDDSDRAQADAILAAVADHLESGSGTIACICNSVRMARTVFEQIGRRAPEADRMLLVGPQRPADRESIFDRPVRPGKDAAPKDEAPRPSRRAVLFEGAEVDVPLVVVATQTIEVGLDIDVDALVTQSASASALTQRLGRLNRAGRAGVTGRATVIRQRDFPLYRADEGKAWDWLESLPAVGDGVDVSVDALTAHPPPPTRPDAAAQLSDDVIDRLTETNSEPHRMAEPDIDALLSGIHSEPNDDVTLFWRSDLHEDDLSADVFRNTLLRTVRPAPAEQLTLSVRAARNLLRNLTGTLNAKGATLLRQTLDGADVEGEGPDEVRRDPIDDAFTGIPFFVLRDRSWLHGTLRSGGGKGVVAIGKIRPGDLIAIPTALGGVDEFGLAPESPVGIDVAADLRPPGGEPGALPPSIRITHGALMAAYARKRPERGPRSQHVTGQMRRFGLIAGRLETVKPGSKEAIQLKRRLFELLAEHPRIDELDPERTAIVTLGLPSDPEVWELEEELSGFESFEELGLASDEEVAATAGGTVALLEEEHEPDPVATGWALVPLSDDREELRVGAAPPTIAEHCLAVADRAEQFARASGLSPDVCAAVRLAGLGHDLGKAEPRMQGFFHGGVAPAIGEPLAKSTFGTGDRSRDAIAREIAGLPRGLRHEQVSVEILIDAAELATDERDLVLHLTASHHGSNHPLPPVPEGGSPPRRFRVEANGLAGEALGDGSAGWEDGEALRRASRLRKRFGPWALAYLESVLMLADRTVSAEGR